MNHPPWLHIISLMLFSIPILIESRKERDSGTIYTARPLFQQTPLVHNENLTRLMASLARELGKHLSDLGKLGRHDALAAYAYNPKFAQHRLELTLDLGKSIARGRFLFIQFKHRGQRIVFTPSLPEHWFDLARSELLQTRAEGVLTHYFRQRQRDEDEDAVKPEDYMLKGTAWVQHLEMDVYPPALYKPPKTSLFLMLGGSEESMSGATELRRVGRCLDWLYPDELDVVLQRDAEARELQRLLDAEDRRPILLVGPRQVGKTALVHEYVRRTVAGRTSRFQNHRNTWLLSPARLISGMSYVGQWENRLLAILKEARQRDHLLYFDDLVGLFRAGQTSQTSLSVAQVLKPYLERREVRVLAEIAPEAYRVLRERDRGLADQFHVFPVSELNDHDTLRVLIGVQRQLEDRHRCEFRLEVLPTVMDLQRRYVRDSAFPGKAAGFLQQLAVKYRKLVIHRLNVLGEFIARSGLNAEFLNNETKLERKTIVKKIGERMIGQESAVEAAADVISIAKARLNDPDRPLASFLFLGPTGVGKTQCAKAIAAYLFGDPERLVRFDMNEFLAPGSAARLAGTFDQPEGLLTSAIRRQPFAVVLFDEIEKAHPEVFDLLLAVLGEGRLTDSLGRTADFSNAILILTSNLGVREAESNLGFGGGDDTARDATFVQAAERFFRPEFFNRLDRVIPFRRLRREEVARIAKLLIDDVFRREGLLQRKVILSVEPAAMERVIDHGFDPELGARALKRAIERFLTQPLSARLSALKPDNFTAIRLYPRLNEIAVHVQALEQVPVLETARVAAGPEVLAQVDATLKEIEEAIAPLRPTGPVSPGTMRPEHYRYFAIREVLDPLRKHWRELDEVEQAKRTPELRLNTPRAMGQRALSKIYPYMRNLGAKSMPQLRDFAKSMNIDEFMNDLVARARPEAGDEQVFGNLLQQTALVKAMLHAATNDLTDRVVLIVHTTNKNAISVNGLAGHYQAALTEEIGFDCEPIQYYSVRTGHDHGCAALSVRGLAAWPLLQAEVGTHLVSWKHEKMEAVQVVVLPQRGVESPEQIARVWHEASAFWRGELQAGRVDVDSDPAPLGPVVRMYDYHVGRNAFGPIVDFRTGIVIPENPPRDYLRDVLLAGLA